MDDASTRGAAEKKAFIPVLIKHVMKTKRTSCIDHTEPYPPFLFLYPKKLFCPLFNCKYAKGYKIGDEYRQDTGRSPTLSNNGEWFIEAV
jgi:hypothetical protein